MANFYGDLLAKERKVVTLGRNYYQVQDPWPRMPEGQEFGVTADIAVALDGRVVLLQRRDPAVLIFTPDGVLDQAWHHPKLDSVHGLAVAPDGTLLIAAIDLHQVLRFDLEGRLLQELGQGSRPQWEQPFNHPTDAAVDPRNGDIVVSDGYGNARLHRFDREGRLLHSWGKPGCKSGEFVCPHGVWVANDGRVIVADRDNNRVQIFTEDGSYLTEWVGFYKPMDVWSDGESFYVSDQTATITAVDMEGRIIGRARPPCAWPHGIWGDRSGNLYICDHKAAMKFIKLP